MSFPAKAMAKPTAGAMLRPLSWNRNKRAINNVALSTKSVRQANQPQFQFRLVEPLDDRAISGFGDPDPVLISQLRRSWLLAYNLRGFRRQSSSAATSWDAGFEDSS